MRSELGIAVWWVLLLGAIVGFLPVRRFGRPAWAALGLLAAYAGWTALGISWSESSERSVEEVARVATLLGILALAIAVQGRDGLRRTVSAVAAAIAFVGLLALLSRLHPDWFPPDNPPKFLTGAEGRLNYPLNYWNGLAALMALGIPLLLVIATHSRRLLTQALAAAAVPVLTLTAFYTFSRGGALEIAVALLALILLHPARLALLPTLALGAAGSVLLISAATQRDALEDGALGALANQQGDEMLAVVLVVCGGVALVRVAIGLAARHGVGPRVSVSRSTTTALFATATVVAAVAALAAGAPSEISDRWSEFKDPSYIGAGVERFDSAGGTGRYQQWQAALDAGDSAPLTGIGSGTYEYWWASEATIPAFVRDAHSLYLEAYAELGIIGFGLIIALIGGVIAFGVSRVLRAAGEDRAYLAAAVAAAAAFAVAAALDWAWELTVIPVTVLLVGAAILAREPAVEPDRREGGSARPSTKLPRLTLAVLAVPALALLSTSLIALYALSDSRDDFRGGQLEAALDSARKAQDLQPWSAAASLQEALVLERLGTLDEAASSALDATEKEPTNWRNWLILSRIEAQRGNASGAVDAYSRAESLNPRSTLFTDQTE